MQKKQKEAFSLAVKYELRDQFWGLPRKNPLTSFYISSFLEMVNMIAWLCLMDKPQ